jgi:hypothetical protein
VLTPGCPHTRTQQNPQTPGLLWVNALRDIAALAKRGILVRNPEGGRSTSYSLAEVK